MGFQGSNVIQQARDGRSPSDGTAPLSRSDTVVPPMHLGPRR